MTDEEFDVLDELYFVQSFAELLKLVEKPSSELVPVIESIYHKGWIKVMATVDDEVPAENINFSDLSNYFFLATKQGLMAHNS